MMVTAEENKIFELVILLDFYVIIMHLLKPRSFGLIDCHEVDVKTSMLRETYLIKRR